VNNNDKEGYDGSGTMVTFTFTRGFDDDDEDKMRIVREPEYDSSPAMNLEMRN
jgi:hypothetical protein